jgi:hypothetical protein
MGDRTTEDTRDLAEHGSDPFGAFGDFDVEQLFDGEGVAQFVCHCGPKIKSQ